MTLGHEFGKNQKLKSRKAIEHLFQEGESVFSYPIKCIYIALPTTSEVVIPPKVAVVAPKRRIKKAVNRNLVKRRMKEAYRQNNGDLLANLEPNNSVNLAFIYVGKEIEPYVRIEKSLIYILDKLGRLLS